MSRDRGSVTIWAAALSGLVWLSCSGGILYGTAVAGRHRAETAADLAALAGAVYAIEGVQAACAEAAGIAHDNGAAITSCRLGGEDVEVVVARRVSFGGLGVRTATARARAGPVDG